MMIRIIFIFNGYSEATGHIWIWVNDLLMADIKMLINVQWQFSSSN
jgi:hypothetical protein